MAMNKKHYLSPALMSIVLQNKTTLLSSSDSTLIFSNKQNVNAADIEVKQQSAHGNGEVQWDDWN